MKKKQFSDRDGRIAGGLVKRFSRGRRSYYLRTLSDELARARAVVDKAAAGVVAGGIEVETEILEGKQADRISELARSRGVDLIIVGSCGRGSIVGALLGSVSEEVVYRADRPVLVVKPRSKTARRAA